MWNIVDNFTPHGFLSGSSLRTSFQNTPALLYILRAISMSRRVRKIGQVRVFGLNSLKSSAVRVNRRSGSFRCSTWCRKNAYSASATGSSRPASVSRQNLIRLSIPRNTLSRFSKSYSVASRRLVTTCSKNLRVE